jgi:hypothetical protein
MDESGDVREVLVVIAPDLPADTASHALSAVEVRHTASPRVHVVSGPPDALAALRTISGLHVITADVDDSRVPADLEEGDALFVEAWLSRRAPKVRRGDGSSWDAPGFAPPDRNDDTT